MKYSFEWTLRNYNRHNPPFNQKQVIYGLMNELIYQHDKHWAFGVRFGMRSRDDKETGTMPYVFNAEWYTVSLGANWTPNKWLTVKPEIRYDWREGDIAKVFNGGRNTNQFSGGMSAVVKF